jgi:hypothetical protein
MTGKFIIKRADGKYFCRLHKDPNKGNWTNDRSEAYFFDRLNDSPLFLKSNLEKSTDQKVEWEDVI